MWSVRVGNEGRLGAEPRASSPQVASATCLCTVQLLWLPSGPSLKGKISNLSPSSRYPHASERDCPLQQELPLFASAMPPRVPAALAAPVSILPGESVSNMFRYMQDDEYTRRYATMTRLCDPQAFN